jgi:hypothetical protein
VWIVRSLLQCWAGSINRKLGAAAGPSAKAQNKFEEFAYGD